MSNYTKATNFYTKDALSTGNPSKLIKGSEIDAEFNAISTAVATKADTTSPTFTGTPLAPTATAGNNTTQLATTAFVTTAVGTLGTMASQNANAVAITGGNINVTTLSTTGAIQAANNIGSGDAAIEIGANRTADGNSYIDFHSALISAGGTGDYDLRIIRVAGANENAFFQNVGTGSIIFNTNGTTRMTLNSAGITGNLVGNATTASNAIGFNQTWQDLTASRAAGTTYTNSTGRPISVSVRVRRDDCWLELYIDSLLISVFGETAGHAQVTVTGIVPAGSTYRVESIYGGTLNWYELR